MLLLKKSDPEGSAKLEQLQDHVEDLKKSMSLFFKKKSQFVLYLFEISLFKPVRDPIKRPEIWVLSANFNMKPQTIIFLCLQSTLTGGLSRSIRPWCLPSRGRSRPRPPRPPAGGFSQTDSRSREGKGREEKEGECRRFRKDLYYKNTPG